MSYHLEPYRLIPPLGRIIKSVKMQSHCSSLFNPLQIYNLLFTFPLFGNFFIYSVSQNNPHSQDWILTPLVFGSSSSK